MIEKIKEFIIRDLLILEHSENISDEDDLLLRGLNSLRIMRLVNFIEDELNLSIPPQDVVPGQLKSLSRIQQLLERLMNEPAQKN